MFIFQFSLHAGEVFPSAAGYNYNFSKSIIPPGALLVLTMPPPYASPLKAALSLSTQLPGKVIILYLIGGEKRAQEIYCKWKPLLEQLSNERTI